MRRSPEPHVPRQRATPGAARDLSTHILYIAHACGALSLARRSRDTPVHRPHHTTASGASPWIAIVYASDPTWRRRRTEGCRRRPTRHVARARHPPPGAPPACTATPATYILGASDATWAPSPPTTRWTKAAPSIFGRSLRHLATLSAPAATPSPARSDVRQPLRPSGSSPCRACCALLNGIIISHRSCARARSFATTRTCA